MCMGLAGLKIFHMGKPSPSLADGRKISDYAGFTRGQAQSNGLCDPADDFMTWKREQVHSLIKKQPRTEYCMPEELFIPNYTRSNGQRYVISSGAGMPVLSIAG